MIAEKIKIKLSELLPYAALFFLFFFSDFFYDVYQLPKSFGIYILLVFSFVAMIFYKTISNPGIPGLLTGIFFIYVFFRPLFSGNYPQTFYVFTLFTPLLFFISSHTSVKIKKFLLFINILVFTACIYGIYQFLSGISRPYSFFGNPIFFGEFLCLLFPLLIISFYFFKYNKLFFLFNIMLGLLSVFLTASRGVFISLTISLLFLFYFLFQNGYLKLKKDVLLYSVFSITLFIFIFFIPGFKKVLNFNKERITNLSEIKTGPVKNRILMIKTAMLMIRENPVFGSGAGSIKYNYQKYQSHILKENQSFEFINTSYIHNDYLHLTAEFGLIGLLIFLVFVFHIFKIFDKYSDKMDKKRYLFSIGLLSSILACLIESFVNFPLFIMPSAAMFWLFSGMLCSIEDKKNILMDKKLSFFILCIILMISFATLGLNSNKLVSNIYLKKAIIGYNNSDEYIHYFNHSLKHDKNNYYSAFYAGYYLGKDKEYEKSLFYFMKALDIYPNSADLLFNIANIYRVLKSYQEAIEYYKKAIDLYPDFSPAHLNLGKTYLDTGLEKLGIDEIAKAKKYDYDKEIDYQNILLFEETAPELNE